MTVPARDPDRARRTHAGPFALLRARRTVHRAARLAGRGRIHQALPLARAASQILRGVAAADAKRQHEYVASLIIVADLHLTQTELGEALTVQDELVAALETGPGPADTPDGAADRYADALTRRADTRRLHGDHAGAAADLDRALETATSRLTLAGAHNAAGILAKDTHRYDDAGDHYAQALAGMREVLGPDHPDLASLFHNLAGLAHACGQHADGEEHARHAIALREVTFGPDSPEVAADLAVLGALLAGQGRHEEAEAIFRATLATWTRHRGPDHYEVAVSLHHLGVLHAARGDRATAGRELRRAWAIKNQTLGPDHAETLALTADLDAGGWRT